MDDSAGYPHIVDKVGDNSKNFPLQRPCSPRLYPDSEDPQPVENHNLSPRPSGGRSAAKAIAGGRRLDRQILALAIPALGALVAEPLFILADTAIVGRLGTSELAGLSLAATVLMTVVGLCVFLAYATTATVGRYIGAGLLPAALRSGVAGLWLAAGLGVVLSGGLIIWAPQLVRLLGAEGDTVLHAVAYLRWSAPGLIGMLLVLAATGVLRGMQDTRTPLYVAVAGSSANVLLNLALVYGLGMGIAGSGLGSTICQLAMGLALVLVLRRYTREHRVSWRPHRLGLRESLRQGAPLFIRSLSLRLAILLTIFVATSQGEVSLAGHQVVNSLWNLAAFILDALAIAAQALISLALGAGDRATVRRVLQRCLLWGVCSGIGLGVVLGVLGGWLTPLFTPDVEVARAGAAALLVAAVFMPMAGWVFVLDGVLIGAGDGRYLAGVGMLTLAIYAPAAWWVYSFGPDAGAGLAWLWVAFAGVFMAARAVTTGLRARTGAWLRVGVDSQEPGSGGLAGHAQQDPS